MTVLVLLVFVNLPVVEADPGYPLAPSDPAVQRAIGYFREIQLPDGDIGYSYMVSAWVTMALASAGVDPHTVRVESTLNSIVDFLFVHDAQLRSRHTSATDWERVILALTAAHENPRTFASNDHIAGLLQFWDGNQFGSVNALNDDFFAIHALRSAGFPADSIYIQKPMQHILAHQNPDGGWSYAIGVRSDSDDTAAAIEALIAAGYQPQSSGGGLASVASSFNARWSGSCPGDAVACALAYLDLVQNPDGGFPYHFVEGGSWVAPEAANAKGDDPADQESTSNTASDAWVIQALVAAGENPTGPRWTTPSGANPVTHLLSLQEPDGSFRWTGTSISGPAWMTAYALPALLGKPYPI